jgi:hypothetical protein
MSILGAIKEITDKVVLNEDDLEKRIIENNLLEAESLLNSKSNVWDEKGLEIIKRHMKYHFIYMEGFSYLLRKFGPSKFYEPNIKEVLSVIDKIYLKGLEDAQLEFDIDSYLKRVKEPNVRELIENSHLFVLNNI